MNRVTKRVLAAVVSLIALAASNGCGAGADATGSNQADGNRKVSVGIIPVVDVAPLYLGKEKGFFKNHGIDLTLQISQGGAAVIPAVVSGQFQFGSSNVASLMLARDQGLPLKIVAPGNASTAKVPDVSAVLVRKDSPIQRPRDLAGKSVAVNTLKNLGDLTIRESVRKDGGDPDAVKFVELAFPDMLGAVEKGRVDAAWLIEPFISIGQSQGTRVLSWNLLDTAPDLMISGYFASEKLINENPKLVKDFIAALAESLKYADEHKDEARKIIKTYTNMSDAVVGNITLPNWPTAVNTESTQKLADLALKDGLIKKPVDMSALVH